jgi:hypothetical protein
MASGGLIVGRFDRGADRYTRDAHLVLVAEIPDIDARTRTADLPGDEHTVLAHRAHCTMAVEQELDVTHALGR